MGTLLEFPASQELRANADVLVAAGLLGAKLNLGQTELAITSATTLAALVAQVATYNTYLPQTIVWHTATIDQAGEVEIVADALVFTPTDAVTPNNIWNMWITDSTGATLLFAGQLQLAPVALNSALNTLQLTCRYKPATNSYVVELA